MSTLKEMTPEKVNRPEVEKLKDRCGKDPEMKNCNAAYAIREALGRTE